jgi:hypothetical protein
VFQDIKFLIVFWNNCVPEWFVVPLRHDLWLLLAYHHVPSIPHRPGGTITGHYIISETSREAFELVTVWRKGSRTVCWDARVAAAHAWYDYSPAAKHFAVCHAVRLEAWDKWWMCLVQGVHMHSVADFSTPKDIKAAQQRLLCEFTLKLRLGMFGYCFLSCHCAELDNSFMIVRACRWREPS